MCYKNIFQFTRELILRYFCSTFCSWALAASTALAHDIKLLSSPSSTKIIFCSFLNYLSQLHHQFFNENEWEMKRTHNICNTQVGLEAVNRMCKNNIFFHFRLFILDQNSFYDIDYDDGISWGPLIIYKLLLFSLPFSILSYASVLFLFLSFFLMLLYFIT